MTVKKGSTVSEDVHSDGKFRSAKSVARYRETHCEGATVKEDVVFKSASEHQYVDSDLPSTGKAIHFEYRVRHGTKATCPNTA